MNDVLWTVLILDLNSWDIEFLILNFKFLGTFTPSSICANHTFIFTNS